MKPPVSGLKGRIAEFICEAGQAGVTKTQLMQRFQVKTADLETVLGPLLMEKRIQQRQDLKRRLGRPATRFYDASIELAAIPLTPEEKPAMPSLPFGAPPARCSSCQVCGAAIPLPEVGRPYVYCSDACRRAARDGGETLRDFLARASDMRLFTRAAFCLVMADLSIRGFQVAGDLFGPMLRLLVHDNAGVTFLDVVVISDSGHFPPSDTYDSAAYVYRDGRITYTGRQPLIQEATPEVVEETTT